MSLRPSILSIGKSVPPYFLSQMEIADRLIDIMQFNEEESWLLKKIYSNSNIGKRYSVLPDILHPKSFLFSSRKDSFISMSDRNAFYKKEAPLLAEKAAREALSRWEGNPEDITHVISVSCTGIMTPGIEFILARKLGLKEDVSLLGINFMGCYGAFKALKVASKIARENPKNRILLVSTELCTLHFKTNFHIETLVIQSLFADGSAAVIMGVDPKEKELSLLEIIDERSSYIPDSFEDMSWDASTEGFTMTLSPRVPKLIGDTIEPLMQSFLKASFDSYTWAIHPGGKAILEEVEKALKLDPSQTRSSWAVLKQYGNLSSATFLYVLENILLESTSQKQIVGLGVGPGLCLEALTLQKNAIC